MDDAGDKQISKINKIDKIGTRLDELFRINLSFSSNFPEGQDPRQHHKILHAHCLQRLYWVGGLFDSKYAGDDNLRQNQKVRRARFVFNLCCQGGSQGVKDSVRLAQIMHKAQYFPQI